MRSPSSLVSSHSSVLTLKANESGLAVIPGRVSRRTTFEEIIERRRRAGVLAVKGAQFGSGTQSSFGEFAPIKQMST